MSVIGRRAMNKREELRDVLFELQVDTVRDLQRGTKHMLDEYLDRILEITRVEVTAEGRNQSFEK